MVTSLQFVQVGGIWASGAARKCGRKFAGGLGRFEQSGHHG
jgi:hypothetical protein